MDLFNAQITMKKVLKLENFREYKAFTRLILGFSTTQVLLLFTWIGFIPNTPVFAIFSFLYLSSLCISVAFGLLVQYWIQKRYQNYLDAVGNNIFRDSDHRGDNSIAVVPEASSRELFAYRVQITFLIISLTFLFLLVLSSSVNFFFQV
jgi:hypothetical protein